MRERELFLAALEFEDPRARRAYLDSACADDSLLLAGVESLLASHDDRREFLRTPVTEQIGFGSLDEFGPVGSSESVPGDEKDGNRLPTASASSHLGADVGHDSSAVELQPYLGDAVLPGSLGRLGRYEVAAVIGQGAFGLVLKAFDEKLQRVVAIKALAPELATNAVARRRFLREARSAAAVRHENVVRIYNVENEPLPYLVMEYVPGQTLQERLDEHGPLSLHDVLRIGKQIADGLAAAHEQQLIHRDIKPSNVLLDAGPAGHVKLTDFGLARTVDDASITQSGFVTGTPLYMSPEQALGMAVDRRADLFSLGSVLYHMVSGQPPFRAETALAVLRCVAEDRPSCLREIIPGVPGWICELLGHLHAKDPAARYHSAEEVSAILGRCLVDLQAGRAPQVPAPGPAGQASLGESVSTKMAAHHAATRPSRFVAALRLACVVSPVLIAGLGLTEAGGFTHLTATVIRMGSAAGTLVIETNDPTIEVEVDGEQFHIRGAGIAELTLRPGQYRVTASKDGKPVTRELVTVTRGGKEVVKLSLEAPRTADQPLPHHDTMPALPANEQIRAVVRELKRLNPEFDGEVNPTVENGVLVGLTLSTDEVSNIRPVRALTTLRSLACEGSPRAGSGKLSDLSPLRGMKLSDLNVRRNPVVDLGPLSGMALRRLHCEHTLVADLIPLAGMPLEFLSVSYSQVRDLTPLRGLPLKALYVEGQPICDLSPLKGMPLESLGLYATRVSDLSVLGGMPLHYLNCEATDVRDLSPVARAPLTRLCISRTGVEDLRPLSEMRLVEFVYAEIPACDVAVLKDMALRRVFSDFRPSRDEAVWRSITTLETINAMPSEQFWQQVDAGKQEGR